jgi:hypothetical protein
MVTLTVLITHQRRSTLGARIAHLAEVAIGSIHHGRLLHVRVVLADILRFLNDFGVLLLYLGIAVLVNDELGQRLLPEFCYYYSGCRCC